MSTLLENLTPDTHFSGSPDFITGELFVKDLMEIAQDLSLPKTSRLQAVNMLFEKSPDDTTLVMNSLCSSYQMSNAKSLRTYLYEICLESKISPFIKSMVATILCSHDEKDPYGYSSLNHVFPLLEKNVSTPYKLEIVKLLMKNSEYKDQASAYFCDIINDQCIDAKYRYKSILGLEEEKPFDFFRNEGFLSFVENELNLVNYRILSGQNLLMKNYGVKNAEKALVGMAKNPLNEYNARADATDVLLQYAHTPETKEKAKEIIYELSFAGGPKKPRTIYDNAQNVHTKEVSESLNTAIEFLQQVPTLLINGKTITFSAIETELLKMVENNANVAKHVTIALNRISLDRALYSKYSVSLENILIKVWSYMSGHESENELKKRLVEELVEMAGTCSSGVATRLVNSISGFGDFSLRISWQSQILSNLTARLNALIKDMDNLSHQEKVLYEMTLESSKPEDRIHFLRFFRQVIPDIRVEMYEEFRGHVDDTDFDLYFRSAISVYETGSSV